MPNTKYKIPSFAKATADGQNTRYTRAFTLIELLVYTGISVVVGMLTTGILLTVTRVNQNASATAEVSGQMNFVLQRLQQLVSESSNIDIDAGITTSSVKLRMQDATKDPTCISLVNGVIKIAEGPGSPNPNDCNSTTSNLTGSKVVVNTLNFKKMVQYPGHDTLSLDMTMAYNTANPGSQVSRSLSSAIGRVSAATFDANLLPGSDNQYEVGYTGQRWKNISISNLLNVGQLANDPTSEMQNGSIYYNTSSSIFRGYQNSAWTNIGSSQWTTSSTAIYYSGGNVGIGTTAPQAKLHVNGTVMVTEDQKIGFRYSAGDPGPYQYITANFQSPMSFYNVYSSTQSNKVYSFYGWNSPSTVELVTILNSGNVGIGTTAPQAKLHVNGTVMVTEDQKIGFRYSAGDPGPYQYITANFQSPMSFYNVYSSTQSNKVYSFYGWNSPSTVELVTILNSGNVGIGTTAPGYTLTVNGTAWVTSGAWSGSDIRWKKDITPLPLQGSLDKVIKLNPVSFNWRTDEFPNLRFSSSTQIGFIAQDVEKIIPEVVTTDNNGYKGMSYERITPVLTAAIQEQQKQIEELKSEIKELKSRLK